jgi:hypothetical protein
MQDVLRALLGLQEVDRDLYRVQQELLRLPAERAARQAELDKVATQASEKRAAAKQLRVRIKELEDVATTARQRVRKVENELASARADVQLLAFYEHQLKTLRREIGQAEDDALKMLEQVETLDNDAKGIEGKLEAEQKVFAELASNIEREVAQAEARRSKLAAERKTRVHTTIPPEALQNYERLLQARGGVALAQLDGRQCQACYMDIPTNMVLRVQRGTELVRCPSCDRILFPAQ